jgi:hypothetical protein
MSDSSSRFLFKKTWQMSLKEKKRCAFFQFSKLQAVFGGEVKGMWEKGQFLLFVRLKSQRRKSEIRRGFPLYPPSTSVAPATLRTLNNDS